MKSKANILVSQNSSSTNGPGPRVLDAPPPGRLPPTVQPPFPQGFGGKEQNPSPCSRRTEPTAPSPLPSSNTMLAGAGLRHSQPRYWECRNYGWGCRGDGARDGWKRWCSPAPSGLVASPAPSDKGADINAPKMLGLTIRYEEGK